MTEPTAPPANAGRLQGGRFVPGVSGNPAGKKPGTRHRATRLAEKLMAGDAEAVVRAIIDAAKGGDMTATRLVLDRFGGADVVRRWLSSPMLGRRRPLCRESPSRLA
jgi:hypothetical protein